MNSKLIWILSGLLAGIIFIYLIQSTRYFNFLPYQIHEILFRGSGNEREFIIFFDLIICIILFFIFKRILSKVNK